MWIKDWLRHLGLPEKKKVSRYLAQAFYIKSQGNTSGGKRMTEQMKIEVFDAALSQNALKPVLNRTWLSPGSFHTTDYVSLMADCLFR